MENLPWKESVSLGATIWELHITGWNTGQHFVSGEIYIESRPWYCDRGRWLAKAELPLDNSEGWPRYYSSIEVAKSEIEIWLKGRKELTGQPYGSPSKVEHVHPA